MSVPQTHRLSSILPEIPTKRTQVRVDVYLDKIHVLSAKRIGLVLDNA